MEATPYNNSYSSAIDSLSIGFERMTQLRSLFLSSSQAKPTTKTVAIGLLDKSLRCVTAALSELQTFSPTLINAATAPIIEDGKSTVSDPKKRKRVQSWTIVTSVPHFDGHLWRKYGQKRIHGSLFPRSYFKCTHNKDQGCPATKTIQQKEDKTPNPPKYKVSYSMQHTCKAIETHEIPFVMDSSAITNSTASSTTASPTYSSHELSISVSSDQPPALIMPLQAGEIEQVYLMESMLLSSEPRGKANGTEDLSMSLPLAALDFNWEWLDELVDHAWRT